PRPLESAPGGGQTEAAEGCERGDSTPGRERFAQGTQRPVRTAFGAPLTGHLAGARAGGLRRGVARGAVTAGADQRPTAARSLAPFGVGPSRGLCSRARG